MSLARTIIGFEWRRYLAAIVVVSLTGLLGYLQAGFVLAQWTSLGAYERELSADIVVRVERPKKLTMSAFMSLQNVPLAAESFFIHSGIEAVEPYYWPTLVDGPGGEFFGGRLSAAIVDTRAGAMAYPSTLGEEARVLLDVPGNALISRSIEARGNLAIGETFAFKGADMNVVGVFTAPFDDTKNVIMSRKTVEAFLPAMNRVGGKPLAVLLSVTDKSKIDETIAELSPWLKKRRLEAIRPEEYVGSLARVALRNDSALQSVLLVAAFAIFISIMITTQTLRAAITTLRSQFGTMQALGISQWRISGLTVELALWTGVLGAVLSVTCGFVLQAVFSFLDLNMLITWELVASITVFLILLSLISGILCLTFVLSVKPVELLR